jgi:hypothetical protein
VRQAAGEVVLDYEGTRCPGDAEHGGAPLRGQDGAGGCTTRADGYRLDLVDQRNCEVGAWRVRGDIEPVDVQELAAAAGPR